MHINIYEIIACSISLIAFIYGVIIISKKDIQYRLYLYACGCYLLEELWVIANSLFGHVDTLITLRLFGIIGTFSFLLTAGINQLNNTKSDIGTNLKSLLAPLIMIVMYAINYLYFSRAYAILEFILLIPMIISSYYTLKALLLSFKYKKLQKYKIINIYTMIFYLVSLIYMYPFINANIFVLEVVDIASSIIMLIIIFACRKGDKHE